MLARVLIVIVVVAVLGFFGTRGSEKVVEEVTTRQAVVDDHGAQLKGIDERLARAEAIVATAEKARVAGDVATQRTVEVLNQRVATLEREIEVLRAEVRDDGQAALHILTVPFGPVTLDGKIVARTEGELTSVRVKRGLHQVTLTDPTSKKKAKFRVNVKEDSPANRVVLVINGQTQTDGSVEAVGLK